MKPKYCGVVVIATAAVCVLLCVISFMNWQREPITPYNVQSDKNLRLILVTLNYYIEDGERVRGDRTLKFHDEATLMSIYHEPMLTQPPYDCAYVVNTSLSGITGGSVPPNVIAAAESRTAFDGSRAYVTIAGAVHRTSENRWRRLYQEQLASSFPLPKIN